MLIASIAEVILLWKYGVEVSAGEHGGQEGQELSTAEGPSFSERHLGTWLHKGSWTGKDPEGGEAELDAIRQGESRQIPVFKVAILLAMFAGEQPSSAWALQGLSQLCTASPCDDSMHILVTSFMPISCFFPVRLGQQKASLCSVLGRP